jgi:hypothetical protein
MPTRSRTEFVHPTGGLQGSAQEWAQQLAELTLTTGMSTYILPVDDVETLRRFAEEVAPAVRRLVDDARRSVPPAV